MNQRVEVLSGEPTPEEVAAIVVALVLAADADRGRGLVPVVPAWLRAARLESVGAGPFPASWSDGPAATFGSS